MRPPRVVVEPRASLNLDARSLSICLFSIFDQISVYIHIYIYIDVYRYINLYICMYIYIAICIFMHIYIRIYSYIYIHMVLVPNTGTKLLISLDELPDENLR